jgi:hypothetical protein
MGFGMDLFMFKEPSSIITVIFHAKGRGSPVCLFIKITNFSMPW